MKKFKYIAITLIFVILFFLLLEFGLRVFEYGDSYPLVKVLETSKGKRYVVNKEVTKRYFNFEDDKIPQPLKTDFDYERREKSLRVICLGGSTTAGFPYDVNANFPFQLQFRLRNALLNHHVEVINFGISAINSFTVLDLLPEVIALEPDLVLIYMGHNEFYGAFGAGTGSWLINNRSLLFAQLSLKKNSRLYQLLSDTISGIVGLFNYSDKSNSIMKIMASDREIEFNSDVFNIAASNYKTNLNEIISNLKNNNITVVLSSLVSNIKDQVPFISAKLNEDSVKAKTISYLSNENRFSSADTLLKQLLEQHSTSADLCFLQGQSYLQSGDSLEAFNYFEKAKDYDLLRFRAPQLFNTILKDAAKNNNVPFLDMLKVFKRASPFGIPGDDLFHEHLHPNFRGYQLMAQSFFEVLRKLQVINPPQPIIYDDSLLNDNNYKAIIKSYKKVKGAITELDLEIGQLRNQVLTSRWPFNKSNEKVLIRSTTNPSIIGQLAYKFLRNEIGWHQAHYKLAEYYISQDQFDLAQKELRAVNLAFYEDWQPHMKLGDLALLKEEYLQAVMWYKSALEKNRKDQNLMAKLGQAYVFNKQFENAIKHLGLALARDLKAPTFTKFQKANLQYFLGLSYANQKNWRMAKEAINESLKFDPNLEAAQKLAREIDDYRQKNEDK